MPVESADVGSVESNANSWWLTDIAPVPPEVLANPDLKHIGPSDVWYMPETQGDGVDVYVVDEGFGKELQNDNVVTAPPKTVSTLICV
jgi:hypothetical protein